LVDRKFSKKLYVLYNAVLTEPIRKEEAIKKHQKFIPEKFVSRILDKL